MGNSSVSKLTETQNKSTDCTRRLQNQTPRLLEYGALPAPSANSGKWTWPPTYCLLDTHRLHGWEASSICSLPARNSFSPLPTTAHIVRGMFNKRLQQPQCPSNTRIECLTQPAHASREIIKNCHTSNGTFDSVDRTVQLLVGHVVIRPLAGVKWD